MPSFLHFSFLIFHFFPPLAHRTRSCSVPRMANSYPTIIPGLRSPADQVGGIVYFGRMLDKIRLAGKLPEGWAEMRGTTVKNTFDDRCCKFLRIDYAAIEAETLKGGKSDEEL